MTPKHELIVPIMDLATTATHTNPPPPPSLSFSGLPTEILLLIAKELYLDAKGPERPCTDDTSSRWESEGKAMVEATTGLAALCRTSGRLNKIVTPILYQDAFLLQQNGPDRCNIRLFYGLVSLLGEQDNGLADLVRIYEDPKIGISDTLGALLDRCNLGPQSYQKLLMLLNKYTPFLSKIVARGHKDSNYLEAPGVMAGLIPAVILCHCRNIKRLHHMSIGGDRGGNHWRFLWMDMVATSVTFPNLEAAKLEGKPFTEGPWGVKMEPFRRLLTPIDEAVFFVNRAPNLRHLTLKSFASSDGPLAVPIRALGNLTSLELHCCAFLKETDLGKIICACPRLERFVFTSEASPSVRRVAEVDFAFIGPALVLKALAPVSRQLKALCIKYAPLVDLMIGNEGYNTDNEDDDDDGDMDTDDETDTNNDMDADENLIKTLGYFQFPNLELLQISHSALHRWTRSEDGPQKGQLVELLKGCQSLESLDITQINIRESQIRPQLEGLTANMGTCTPLLNEIRVSIDTSERQHELDWIIDNSKSPRHPYLKGLFAKKHLATYRRRGIKLRIDYEHYRHAAFLEPSFPAVGSSHEDPGVCYHTFVTVHPDLRDFMPAAKDGNK
ncbi:hypothetical protein QBC32DRAFT_257953 [Pseudoneurospora amorphoporcata]|uniref:F-box domain-containing protein n=1 Tax=Pseudoneurospora amorphoporcata TaxID=241081 RepID=A0AAN6P0A7_9PEZI|nr:hypothetical protein QBC32DRAFT_257953 [Pseudoneurospora amorphoporcata]